VSSPVTARFGAIPLASYEGECSSVANNCQDHREIVDEDLLASIAHGDQHALTLLFQRYSRLVRIVSLRILRDEA
jgi:hypothetical protein